MKLDDTIDRLFLLRETKRGLEGQIKEVNADIDTLNNSLIAKYDEIGTVTARGRYASATITESVVPTIEDWGKVSQYILDNDAMYLVHRRISSGPWKELVDTGAVVPGIVPFTKRAISLRKLGD